MGNTSRTVQNMCQNPSRASLLLPRMTLPEPPSRPRAPGRLAHDSHFEGVQGGHIEDAHLPQRMFWGVESRRTRYGLSWAAFMRVWPGGRFWVGLEEGSVRMLSECRFPSRMKAELTRGVRCIGQVFGLGMVSDSRTWTWSEHVKMKTAWFLHWDFASVPVSDHIDSSTRTISSANPPPQKKKNNHVWESQVSQRQRQR